MKVININHSSGKVVGASAFFVQFLWLHWKSVEWICLQWEPQQSRLGMDDTETICVQTLRALDGTFPWHIVKSRLSHKVLNFSIISLWYAWYILPLLLIRSCNSSFHQSNNWPNVHPKDNKQVTFACFSRLQQTSIWYRWCKSKINVLPDLKLFFSSKGRGKMRVLHNLLYNHICFWILHYR